MRKRRTVVLGAAMIAVIALAAPAAAQDGPELVGSADLDAGDGVTSHDGRRVAYLVLSEGEPAPVRVMVRDRAVGSTKVVYTSPPERSARIDLSGNGRYVAILTFGPGGGHVLQVRDVDTGKAKWLGRDFTHVTEPSLSDNGLWVGFTGHRLSDPRANAYRWSLATGTVTQVTSGSLSSKTVISGDGKKVAYNYRGHVYARTVATRATVLADARPDGQPANDYSEPQAFSANGRYLLFVSRSTDLATGTTVCTWTDNGCAFRRDLVDGRTNVASRSETGVPVAVGLGSTDFSADGKVVAFADGDQVRVRRLSTGTTKLASLDAAGNPGDDTSWDPSLTADGSGVVFTSRANNLAPEPPSDRSRVWRSTVTLN